MSDENEVAPEPVSDEEQVAFEQGMEEGFGEGFQFCAELTVELIRKYVADKEKIVSDPAYLEGLAAQLEDGSIYEDLMEHRDEEEREFAKSGVSAGISRRPITNFLTKEQKNGLN